ncbi:hypothetical protein VE02_06952 [Pseudogymnoascus sp. 03VT05]|nr:hypothetical protein VE02_06952 [Pseudogymnoascus sp. 03VT05]
MYEDTWYSFVPDVKPKKDESSGHKLTHRRKESLLKQPNESDLQPANPLEPLDEEESLSKGPPQATIARRAKSYTDFYHVAHAQITKEAKKIREQELRALKLLESGDNALYEGRYEIDDAVLLDVSQDEFQLYRDQLALSERHLDNLVEDTSRALDLLSNLSDSFKAVEAQTVSFQSQCEDLLLEQKRLKDLADEVGTDLQYYSYLEPITRRLNAPGASTMIGDESFVEILSNLDACIVFMRQHPEHKESETYLTRYRTLLTRTLSLLQISFTNSIRTKQTEARAILSKAAKLNTTTVYLIQAPDIHPTGSRLERSIEHIIFMARPVYDHSIKHDLQGGKETADGYYTLFKSLMDEYVLSRKGLMSEVLGQVLNGAIAEDHDPKTEFGKYARACFNTTLEVCMNEYSKYGLFFSGNRRTHNRGRTDFHKIWKSQESQTKYLEDLCSLAFRVLEPHIQRADTTTTTQLALWLDSYASSADGNDDESFDGAQILEGNRELKIHLAGQLKKQTTQVIFTRIKEMLYANVSRFFPKPEDLEPKNSTQQTAEAIRSGEDSSEVLLEPADTDIDGRAYKALGDGFSNSYKPLKTGAQLLILNNDLTFDANIGMGMGEMAYEIIHETSLSIMRASGEVARKDRIDSYIFAIKNLVLLKNLILAYEISGSRQAAALDFTRMWTTFSELRNRGGLFDVRAYYTLITTGELLPEVVTTVQDARVELDGLLRETITKFREECAGLLWKQYGFPLPEKSRAGKKKIQDKLEVMFTHERELRENLWAAVEETLADRKK